VLDELDADSVDLHIDAMQRLRDGAIKAALVHVYGADAYERLLTDCEDPHVEYARAQVECEGVTKEAKRLLEAAEAAEPAALADLLAKRAELDAEIARRTEMAAAAVGGGVAAVDEAATSAGGGAVTAEPAAAAVAGARVARAAGARFECARLTI